VRQPRRRRISRGLPDAGRRAAGSAAAPFDWLIVAAPNTSVFLQAQAWAFLPAGDPRRGLRSHETVDSAAAGVPHGWWVEARWH
jgi:hypothetical protein